jgi:hypothetical protein
MTRTGAHHAAADDASIAVFSAGQASYVDQLVQRVGRLAVDRSRLAELHGRPEAVDQRFRGWAEGLTIDLLAKTSLEAVPLSVRDLDDPMIDQRPQGRLEIGDASAVLARRGRRHDSVQRFSESID